MARKRSPDHDYICQGCGCPCDLTGTKHLGGGQGMKACAKPVRPILRREHEAEVAEMIRVMRSHQKR